MEIEQAFTSEAINAAGTNVTEEEQTRLADLVREYINTNELVVTRDEDIVDLSVLMFVAGRTDQANNSRIVIGMTPAVISQFLEFLTTQKE